MGVNWENGDEFTKRAHENWLEKQRQTGRLEYLEKTYSRCIGFNHGKRHLVTNKEFKPLKDLLGQSDCGITNDFHKMLCDTFGLEQFVMSPEMGLEVQRLTDGFVNKPQDLEKWLPKVKPPYPNVCVEMPITEEMHKMRAPVKEGASQVCRIGAYIQTIEEDDGILITFSPYYEFESGYVICSQVLLANLNNQSLKGFIPIRLIPFDIIWNATFHPTVIEAARKNNLPPETFWERMGNSPDMLTVLASEAAEELPGLFFAWLVLLNSKSGVTKTKVPGIVPNPKLGKRERARRGRSSYTVVSLTDTEDVDSAGMVMPKRIVTAHRVRGHFKMKKWGVFWWRPHVRGIGELKEREAYKVVT